MSDELKVATAYALKERASLSENALQSLMSLLKNDDRSVRKSIINAFEKQTTLSKNAL